MALHLRKRRIASATALVTTLLAPLPVAAARASTAQRAACGTAPADPSLAAQLSRDLRVLLAARHGVVSVVHHDVALHDPAEGVGCALGSSHRDDTASITKVMIMAAALRRAQDWGRGLTAWEHRTIRPLITRSDNTAAGRLRGDLGQSCVARFLGRAQTAATTLIPYARWDLRRLGVLTGARARAYGLEQLNALRRDQR
ncbi:hypothetical protein ACWGII_20580 [Streptomyces sp. NPDC054855]